jgi:hypothetical protein
MSEDQGKSEGTQDLSKKAENPYAEHDALGNPHEVTRELTASELGLVGNGQGGSDSSSSQAAGEKKEITHEQSDSSATEKEVTPPNSQTPPSTPATTLPNVIAAAAASAAAAAPNVIAAAAASAAAAAAAQTQLQVAPKIVGGAVVPGSVVTGLSVAPVVTDTPAVAAPAAPSFIATGITDVDSIVEGLMKNATVEGKIVINTIKEYILAMKPGRPIAIKDGVRFQVSFYNALLAAINNLEGDFRPTLQSILALLHAHKDGAFRETHVFRFVEHVPLSAEHRKGFQKITTLLKTLANPQTRQGLLRQMNFDPLLQYGLTERGRTKLAAFFGK